MMNTKFLYLIFIALTMGNITFSQNCENGFTYYPEVPENVNVLDGSTCFADNNLEVLNDLITINSLDYSAPLEVGVQTWLSNQLYGWVATYTPNGVNGVNQQLSQLPESMGQLTYLKQLYLEWNSLTILPDSFSQLIALKT